MGSNEEVEFRANMCQGGRITVPILDRRRLSIERGTRVRVKIRKDISEEEEEFLVKVGQGGRVMITLVYREKLGLEQGDRLRVKIKKDIPEEALV